MLNEVDFNRGAIHAKVVQAYKFIARIVRLKLLAWISEWQVDVTPEQLKLLHQFVLVLQDLEERWRNDQRRR